jgi:hypothetical protein
MFKDVPPLRNKLENITARRGFLIGCGRNRGLG